MNPGQERQLVQQAQEDPRRFVHLYDAFLPRIHAYVGYRVSSREDAEDLVANVFLHALRRLPDFRWRKKGSFTAWLFRIAHNQVIDYYRKQDQPTSEPGLGSDLDALSSQAGQPHEVLVQQESVARIRALVATLSPRRQEVITLRFFGGFETTRSPRSLVWTSVRWQLTSAGGCGDLKAQYDAQIQSDAAAEVRV